ncbi:MAG: polyisoprenoid-binding protein [Burkholderiales bacterium]|nr:polyisoprenoid-binding protein [Burkholderiales bacterium]MDE2395181.1 polyisoprenoid-binding protein [Burkholderiales bacterium]MDE2454882.1 polyisoprenoid-binding protein [Burkholderiales bacterium]
MKSIALAGAALAAPSVAQAETATYAVDPYHASVHYKILHMGTSTSRGRIGVKSGTVRIDRAAKTGHAELTIDTATFTTGIEELNQEPASAAFFDSANFPTGRFVAYRFRFDGDKVGAVSGQLTLRGKTHPVTLEAVNSNCYVNPMLKREVCGGDFTTTIKRSLWGINWGLEYGFADDVPLAVQVEAIKQ